MEQREITPDLVMEIGKEVYEAMLAGLRPEDFLKQFNPEEILSKYKMLFGFLADKGNLLDGSPLLQSKKKVFVTVPHIASG